MSIVILIDSQRGIKMEQFEYKVVYFKGKWDNSTTTAMERVSDENRVEFEKVLNVFGLQGWELIGFVPQHQLSLINQVACVFKRKRVISGNLAS